MFQPVYGFVLSEKNCGTDETKQVKTGGMKAGDWCEEVSRRHFVRSLLRLDLFSEWNNNEQKLCPEKGT